MTPYRTFQVVVLVILAAVFIPSHLARRFPHVTWLRRFHFEPPQVSEEERRRRRRSAAINDGIGFVLAGIIIPIGYVAANVMFFSAMSPVGIALTAIASLLCIGIGIASIARRDRD